MQYLSEVPLKALKCCWTNGCVIMPKPHTSFLHSFSFSSALFSVGLSLEARRPGRWQKEHFPLPFKGTPINFDDAAAANYQLLLLNGITAKMRGTLLRLCPSTFTTCPLHCEWSMSSKATPNQPIFSNESPEPVEPSVNSQWLTTIGRLPLFDHWQSPLAPKKGAHGSM